MTIPAEPKVLRRTLRHSSPATFEPGLYEHYKGGRYTALGLVVHHETRIPMAHYVSLAYGTSQVREFCAPPMPEQPVLTAGDGRHELTADYWCDLLDLDDGRSVPRFKRLMAGL